MKDQPAAAIATPPDPGSDTKLDESLWVWGSEATEKRLKAWNFKGLGAWNHACWKYRATPYTECLNIWKSLWVKGQLKPIFDPDWDSQVEALVKPQIRGLLENVFAKDKGNSYTRLVPWRLQPYCRIGLCSAFLSTRQMSRNC